MKNAFDGIISQLIQLRKKISELENTSETSKTKRQKQWQQQQQNKQAKQNKTTKQKPPTRTEYSRTVGQLQKI